MYSRYIDDVPSIIVSLYLGPLSDSGRKPIMLVPFLGHIISGTLMILICLFPNWDARFIWLSESYILFGGYSLLNIAMYGYIGDVSSAKERTTLIAVLGALGFIMMPFANFAGGQIYNVGGFLAVYITSLAFVILGIAYILVIPESVVNRTTGEDDENKDDAKGSRVNPF